MIGQALGFTLGLTVAYFGFAADIVMPAILGTLVATWNAAQFWYD